MRMLGSDGCIALTRFLSFMMSSDLMDWETHTASKERRGSS